MYRTPSIRPSLLATAIAALLTCSSASAFALDGYQDRRGLFWGLGIGGGVGLVDVESTTESTGLDTGRKVGMHLSGALGGGVSDSLTVGAEGNWWLREVRLGDNVLSHQHMSFNGIANLFVFEGFFLEAGAGLAYAVFDSQRANQELRIYRELGLAAKAGAGFEYFVNSQIALGMRFGYTRHFYNNADFDVVSAGFSFRWY